ncbi:TFIIH/NER complex subunit [Lecanora helva]
MSRNPMQNGVQSRQQDGDDDICPVCKSARYLNPNMRFLINPECYHKMCESCVDRIFSQGPAPCPVAGCARALRKQRFRPPRFEDLQIEREVDVRRRISAIFNRRESEFNTLRDYNNYLEEVEAMTFNLISNIDVAETEVKIAAYSKENAQIIAQNKAVSAQESASAEALFAAQKEDVRLRREAARKEEEDERREKEESRREIISKIAHSSEDPEKIARESQKVVLKKSTARRTAAERARQQQDAMKVDNGNAPTYTVAGLKPVVAPTAEKERVYDPFMGFVLKREYHMPQKKYENPLFEKRLKAEPRFIAGGYDVGEYCARATLEAFAGLGVFVEEEISARDRPADAAVGTASAAAAVDGTSKP